MKQVWQTVYRSIYGSMDFYNIDCVSYEQDMLTCMEILENCIVEDTDIVCMYPLDDSAAEIQKKGYERWHWIDNHWHREQQL